jgi:hypothetical protein
MKHNNCNVDQLLKETSANYFTGLTLWRKAQDAKRLMLNDMHAVFCQEVCHQWPTVPSGTTTIDSLLLELRKNLWFKKCLELKDGRVHQANVNAQDAKKNHEAAVLQHGLIPAAAAETKLAMDSAFTKMESMKAEELSNFDVEWAPHFVEIIP